MASTDLLDGMQAAVFDAYGTLFDVNAAVRRHAAEVGPQARPLSETWRTKQLEYSWIHGLMDRYEPFWTLTERALDFALAKFPNVDRGLRERLLDAYRDLDAYEEVPATLSALRERGIRTAILTNGDRPMIDRAVASAKLGGLLDAVLTVDEVRRFKTHPDAYGLASTVSASAGRRSCSAPRTAGILQARPPSAFARSGSIVAACPTSTRISRPLRCFRPSTGSPSDKIKALALSSRQHEQESSRVSVLKSFTVVRAGAFALAGLLTATAIPASARDGQNGAIIGGLAAGVVGGVVGSAIVNNMNNPPPPRRRNTVRAGCWWRTSRRP